MCKIETDNLIAAINTLLCNPAPSMYMTRLLKRNDSRPHFAIFTVFEYSLQMQSLSIGAL